MKLSIITINYNNCDGLRKTIESVVVQTFKDFEWIVIDGGSTDGSRELIEQYAEHFAYWVSEPDEGIYNAMNKGIKVAKGEYLQFLNSGDWLCDSFALSRCFAHDFEADVLYGNVIFTSPHFIKEYRYPSPLTFKQLFWSSLAHPSCFIKRSILLEEKYNENYKIVSDLELWIKLALRNAVFIHLNEFVACFDCTGISSTNSELDKAERAEIIAKWVPDMVSEDYKRLKELELMMNDKQVQTVVEYGHKIRKDCIIN